MCKTQNTHTQETDMLNKPNLGLRLHKLYELFILTRFLFNVYYTVEVS